MGGGGGLQNLKPPYIDTIAELEALPESRDVYTTRRTSTERGASFFVFGRGPGAGGGGMQNFKPSGGRRVWPGGRRCALSRGAPIA